MSYRLILIFFPFFIFSQTKPIKFFFQCRCDSNFIKDEISYVDFVRDQEKANVIAYIYNDPNGNQGKYSIYFEGNQKFDGIKNELYFESHPKMTSHEIRLGLKNKIELGLLKYIVQTDQINSIKFDILDVEKDTIVSVEEEYDKWKNWIFEISISGNYEKESSRKESNLSGRFEINRYTEKWRIENTFRYNKNTEEFLNQDQSYSSERLYKGLYGKLVRSISDHWSTGIFYGFSEDSYQNINFSNTLYPAIEYSIFPYKDVVRKEMVLEYKIGYKFNKYDQTTIYGKDSESLSIHSAAFKIRFRQKWGDIYSRLSAFSYLNDSSKNRLTFDNYFNIRVYEGLSINLGAEIRFIRDQINLAAGVASVEDVLLQQRSIATDYYNEFRLGLTYTFGSAFNNIINTRL